MIVLSFDCAYRTLGVACIDFDILIHDKCNGILERLKTFGKLYDDERTDINERTDEYILRRLDDFKTIIEEFNHIRTHMMQVHYTEVINVIPKQFGCKTKDLSSIERITMLKHVMNDLDKKIAKICCPEVVLIEYQMSANDQSREVSHCIAYHYADKAHVESVSPSGKFAVQICGITFNEFVAKYASKYTANKAFAIAIVRALYRMADIPYADTVATSHVSDAIIQAVYYLGKISL